MSLFPKIESPCPFRDDLSDIMNGDVCSQCERQVFDLTAMPESDKAAFLGACSGEVCVSYKLPIGRALAATAMASATLMSPVLAGAQSTDDLYCNSDDMVIIVGGLRKGNEAELVTFEPNETLDDLPVVYEDDAARAEMDKMFGMTQEDADISPFVTRAETTRGDAMIVPAANTRDEKFVVRPYFTRLSALESSDLPTKKAD